MDVKRSFRRDETGATAVEFAMLAPVFFLMIMGLVDFVLFQYKTYALNHVVYEASRNLQTGEVQMSGSMSTAFHTEVCSAADTLINCNEIFFDVRAFDKVKDITYPPVTYDADGKPTNFVFEPGNANQYSVVRASMKHMFVTPFMSQIFSGGNDKPSILNAFSVVKDEPWAN